MKKKIAGFLFVSLGWHFLAETAKIHWIEVGKSANIICELDKSLKAEAIYAVEWNHIPEDENIKPFYSWNMGKVSALPEYQTDINMSAIQPKDGKSVLHYKETKYAHEGSYSCSLELYSGNTYKTESVIQVYQSETPYLFQTKLVSDDEVEFDCRAKNLRPKPDRVLVIVSSNDTRPREVKFTQDSLHVEKTGEAYNASFQSRARMSHFENLTQPQFKCVFIMKDSYPRISAETGEARMIRRMGGDKSVNTKSNIKMVLFFYSVLLLINYFI